MLNELHIENIAVIEKADISFSSGLNVLTGETGAGKSIVIDSIGAVLGERVSKELVRSGADRGVVTAVFDADGVQDWLDENEIDCDGELILQRRIGSDGKSSCRVCGSPVTAAQLKEISARLVDIHGQNDGRQLMDERRHIMYLDSFGELGQALGVYREKYAKYRDIEREIKKLSMDELEKATLSDSLKYRIAELEGAELKKGEYDELSSRRDLLRNSEKLTEALDAAYNALSGGEDNALSMAQNASYYSSRAAAIMPELDKAAKNINDAVFLMTDASELLSDLRESLDFSPEEYDRIETRLSQLGRLQRKYRCDEAGLIELLSDSREKLDEIEYSDERLAKLERELLEQEKLCALEASRLHGLREKAAATLEKRILSELRDLSMPSVRFAVEFLPLDGGEKFDNNGSDRLRFIMSANAGEELGRISRIASGGELSRIMLAMKNVLGEKDSVQTMIFDEIDTGVSGVAAQRVGEKLFHVSKGRQVLCVTHLPQIASMADSQYLIVKSERDGRTYTDVRLLDDSGRRREIARLYGGDNITGLTLESAGEQLRAAESFKHRTQEGSKL